MYLCLISLVNREIKTKMCKQFSMVIKLEKNMHTRIWISTIYIIDKIKTKESKHIIFGYVKRKRHECLDEEFLNRELTFTF